METELASCPASLITGLLFIFNSAAWHICRVVLFRPSGVSAYALATRQGELNNSKQVKQTIPSHLTES